MYEQFRGELMVKLSSLDAQTLQTVLQAVDAVATSYTMEKVGTDLIVYQYGLPEQCKAYLVSRSIEGVGARTIKLYQNVLTKFFCSITKPIERIQTNDIRVWLYKYEELQHISKRTMQLYRLIINGFFEWAAAQGWTSSNPCSQIKPIKYPKKQRKAMTQLQLEYIRQACTTPLQSVIVQMLYSTGCRVSELSTIKLSDINWQRREVVLFGKGQKYRTAYLNAKAVVSLRRYIRTRNDDSDALIVTTHAPHKAITRSGLQFIVRNIANRVRDKLSVPVTPHIFRHTTATHALANGMPIQNVQIMLGHSNISTTMVYAQVSHDAVQQAHKVSVI